MLLCLIITICIFVFCIFFCLFDRWTTCAWVNWRETRRLWIWNDSCSYRKQTTSSFKLISHDGSLSSTSSRMGQGKGVCSNVGTPTVEWRKTGWELWLFRDFMMQQPDISVDISVHLFKCFMSLARLFTLIHIWHYWKDSIVELLNLLSFSFKINKNILS